MEIHPNLDLKSSKDISCKDCGFVYSVASAALSSACERCGNIAYHPAFTTSTVREDRVREQSLRESRGREAETSVRRGAVSMLSPNMPEYDELALPFAPVREVSLRPFTRTDVASAPPVDPMRIEEIAIQNQLEWQLWARVSLSFADPNAHLAYLSFVARNLCFDRATERYKTHRKKFALVKGEAWQVEKADSMLDAIAGLCDVQFERASKTDMNAMDQWALRGNKLRFVYRMLFFALGMVIAANLVSGMIFRLK